MPIHPRTAECLKLIASEMPSLYDDILIIPPVGYFDMLELLKFTQIVFTDSGGVQKEAYFFEKPCVTLRNETEWTELVGCGCNCLSGTDTSVILACYIDIRNRTLDFSQKFYGDGNVSAEIVRILSKFI